MIWFVKEPTSTDPLYRIVEFQPDRFSRNEINRVAVNLARRTYYDFDYSPEEAIQKGDFYVPFTSWIWGAGKPHTDDNWWYVYPLDELDKKLSDMLAVIIKYGIPFLEDPNSTHEQAIGMRKGNR